MLLAIDIGNTNTVLGAFNGEDLAQHWRIATRADATGDELGVTLRGLFASSEVSTADIDHVIVSSVVPVLNEAVVDMCTRHFGMTPLGVAPGVRAPVHIRYDNPKEVGADRIVNAVAAFRKYGGPAVVIDFGTATTFDAIAANGDYLGGAIAPGIRISMEALFSRAAKLPLVELIPPRDANLLAHTPVNSMPAAIIFRFLR